MAERLGSLRLCHDMSWPKEVTDGVDSPNDADELAMVVVFVRIAELCLAIAIMSVCGSVAVLVLR